MAEHKPRSREKNLTAGGGNVNRRGAGLGTGPVGSGDGYHGRQGGGRMGRRAAIGGGISLPVILIAVVYFLLGGGGAGNMDTSQDPGYSNSVEYTASESSNALYQVDETVASGSRGKRTVLQGDGSDIVTIMVYLCGTDLESKSGMATNDLSEMAAADFGDNVNLIVYTGGCTKWQTEAISSQTNQIYQVADGRLTCLMNDDGAKPMTDPDTLSRFIRWCGKNYPANRNELIFWDHGGGSVSGYGYDEKYKSSGSMSLSGIQKALKDGGMAFDVIGFDACLMATAETALMLGDYGDYLLASEETEPGIGWYYTNWLTKLGKDTGMSSLELGKNIIDDFTNACASRCRGQQTTLSLIDLAEFSNTVPERLSEFSKAVKTMIVDKDYQAVSDARYQTREFAKSSKIDQVDLADFATKVGGSQGSSLAKALKGSVKYNRTSSGMTNAYGVSIYFPYKRTSYVDRACTTYKDIGMDAEYAKCIREFAGMEAGGQAAAGGASNPLGSLLGEGASGGISGGSELIGQLLTSFLSDRSMVDGLDASNTEFLSDRELDVEETGEYLADNHLDADNLFWKAGDDGTYVLELSKRQWKLVHDIDLNLFYDDGEGYVDLGLDNMFSYDDNGNLVADTDGTWLSINGQVVPYYHLDTTEGEGDAYTITGRVPVLLNGVPSNLILVFTEETPEGFIAGAATDYTDGETETVPKNLVGLESGDTLDFVCDYYTYDGQYQDSYLLGEQLTVTDQMTIGDVPVGDGNKKLTYRLTDLYNQEYWTPAIQLD